ncbi:MAG: ROK family protein [Sulfitobacter sp.]|nr:ROK family protein [Sulfitobacter sp.]
MWHLVADVGGTNMRLAALSPEGAILEQCSFASADAQTVPDACAAFISGRGADPAWIVVAAAGPVREGAVKLTNVHQTLTEAQLAAICPSATVRILNDFEAAAWSLATVSQKDVEMLRGALDNRKAPRLIIGPGTGLGVGALIWAQGQPQVVAGEGGHVSLAPRTFEESPYFEALVAAQPDFRIGNTLAVEAEAILSGTGMPHFYRAIAQVEGQAAPLIGSGEIFAAARDRRDGAAVRAVTLFRDYLGGLAGDLGLAFGAWGGIFLTGGVAQSNRWLFDDAFLSAVNAGGRHTAWRERLPVCLYQDANFGLLGARNYIAARERGA